MKTKTQTYLRTFFISLIIIMCLTFGWLGIAAAYENTVLVAFGEYKSAIEISDKEIRILDFVINI